jgi:hypothetical protein
MHILSKEVRNPPNSQLQSALLKAIAKLPREFLRVYRGVGVVFGCWTFLCTSVPSTSDGRAENVVFCKGRLGFVWMLR